MQQTMTTQCAVGENAMAPYNNICVYDMYASLDLSYMTSQVDKKLPSEL